MHAKAVWLAATGVIWAGAAWGQASSPPANQTAGQTSAATPPPAAAGGGPVGIEDIVVTATRTNQALSKVPVSVSAFTGAKLETLGLKSFADIQRFTPGITFDPQRNDISIRGVRSEAGTGTTGIYIDDTPIQVRALGLNANNTLPIVFDLERVEVLRGPQGTLFGAGSEGGTVRYITPQPSTTEYTGYARAEVTFTEHGEPSYEGGVAVGGPLIRDRLGFRASAWFRRDGGYVNRVDYQTLKSTDRDANNIQTYALRAALAWTPTETLTVTPSIFQQNRRRHQDDLYWVGVSRPSRGDFLNGTPDRQSDKDRFTLPALKIDLKLGEVELVSNTSYFNRREVVNGYSGTLYNLSLFQQLIDTQINFNGDDNSENQQRAIDENGVTTPLLTPTGINLPQFPNYVARNITLNKQRNFTQEVRLQSTNADARFTWVAGIFYASNKQVSQERIYDPFLPDLAPILFGTTLEDFSLGVPLLPNDDSYINRTRGYDEQLAFFADGTFGITDTLKITAGVRYALTKFSFQNFADGPQNLGFSDGTGSKKEKPFTPKIGVQYQPNGDNLFYGTVSKGFRIGGANPPFPQSACQADLDALGITSVPSAYKSDNVWSYEVGAKNKLFSRKLSFSGSLYYLEWDDIQQATYLTSCGFQYTGNLGTVHSEGFDAQLQYQPVQAVTLDAAIGYTKARYSRTQLAGPNPESPPLALQGNTIPDVSPWTVSLGGQYSYTLAGNDGYIRADYQFQSKNPYRTPAQDPRNPVSDPALRNDPATHQVSVRTGYSYRGVLLEAFVNNLFDQRPQLGLTHQDQFTLLFEAQTLRPRTWGLAASYRY